MSGEPEVVYATESVKVFRPKMKAVGEIMGDTLRKYDPELAVELGLQPFYLNGEHVMAAVRIPFADRVLTIPDEIPALDPDFVERNASESEDEVQMVFRRRKRRPTGLRVSDYRRRRRRRIRRSSSPEV
jgi:hypothetical protein